MTQTQDVPDTAAEHAANSGEPYSDWFIVEGRITAFHWHRSTENVLEAVQKNAKTKNTALAAAAVATQMYGALATSSMVAMYDGEDTQAFACRVGEHVVYGQFEGAKLLKDGDDVKVIVSRAGEALFAHSVLREKDELLWLPGQVYCGDKAAARQQFHSDIRGVLVIWVVVGLFALGFLAFDERVTISDALVAVLVAPVLMATLVFFVSWLPGRAGKEFGETGSAIFRMFGFPDPDNLNMQLASLGFQTEDYGVDKVYMYRLALEAHASGKKIETRFDRMAAQHKPNDEARSAARTDKKAKTGHGA